MKKKKKGFLLYADMIEQFDLLTDSQAGVLIKTILIYAGGDEPEITDPFIAFAFAGIKTTLDRDKQSWLETLDARSRAGKASAEARKKKKEQGSTDSTRVKFVEHTSTNSTDSVSDSDSDSVSDSVSDISKESRKRSEIEFDQFWSVYPKKSGKQTARKAWNAKANKSKPAIEAIIAAVSSAKESKQWSEDSGRYIPNPSTWLNRHGWDDEADTEKATGSYYDQNKVF